jgi:hypothetical protein
VGSVVNAPRNGDSHARGLRSKALPPWAEESADRSHTRTWATQPQHSWSDEMLTPASYWEGIEQLRAQIADLANERDVLKETAALLLEEAQGK